VHPHHSPSRTTIMKPKCRASIPNNNPGTAFHRTRVKFAWGPKMPFPAFPTPPHSILRSVKFQGGQICDSGASLIAAMRRPSPPELNDTSDNIRHLLATFTSVHSGTLKTAPPRTDGCFRVSAIGFPLLPLPWHPKPNQHGRYTRSEPSIPLITSLLLTRGDTTVSQGDVSLWSRSCSMVVCCSFDRSRSYIESYGF
jgi:hypothetical protein